MEYKSVYFAPEGEKGLNETSASHLCAIASQIKEKHEKTLTNVCFVNSYINVVGSEAGDKQTGTGLIDLTVIDIAIAEIARMNSFISWFAEAREALENVRKEINGLDLHSWMNKMGIEVPEAPICTSSEIKISSLADIIAEMNVKDRQIYLSLEARSSVYGKFIHPDRPMDRARSRMHEAIAKPYTTDGSGRDTIIYRYEASIAPYKVDDEFNKLQAEYRKVEQQLNHMKSDLRKKLDIRNTEENNERNLRLQKYKEERAAYDQKIRELTLQFGQWVLEEKAKISKIKFVIPENLKDTYKYLNSLVEQ